MYMYMYMYKTLWLSQRVPDVNIHRPMRDILYRLTILSFKINQTSFLKFLTNFGYFQPVKRLALSMLWWFQSVQYIHSSNRVSEKGCGTLPHNT